MRRITRIAWWTAGTLGALLALTLAVWGALNTDAGRRAAERLTAALTHDRVQLSGLAGRFPDDLQLARLQLGDGSGRWLDAEGITLRWSPLRLLRRQVRVETLRAERLDIERAPIPEKPSPPSSPGSWWRGLELGQLEVPQLTLGAALAGTPAALSVRASGHLNHADDTSIDLVATQSNGSGRYTLTYRADADGLGGELLLDEPTDGPLAHVLQVPDLGAIHVAGKLAGAREMPRVELDAALGALRGSADGTVDWRQRTADLTFSARSGEMAPRADLGWRQLSIDGRWQGGIAAPTATATTVIAGLRAAGSRIESLRAEAGSDAGKARATAQVTGLQIPGDHPQLFADAPLQLQADTDLRARPRRVAFTLAHPLLQARGDAIFAGKTEVNAALQLPRLETLAALAGMPLTGTASLAVRYAGSGAEGSVNADGSLRVTGGGAPLPALIGGDGKLKVAVAWNAARLRIDEARFTGIDLTANASGGRSERGEWDLTWRAAVADLMPLYTALQGKASADGRLRGAGADLRAEARIQADASISGSPRAPLEATLTATHLTTQPEASLDVRGMLDAAPLQLTVALRRDAARTVHVQVSRGEWKSARLSGQMDWPATDKTATAAPPLPGGRLELRIARLEDLNRFTGQSLPGQLTVRLDSPRSGSTLQWQVDAQNLQFQAMSADAQIRATGSFEQLALNAAVQLRGAPGGDAQLVSTAALNLPQKQVTLNTLRIDYQKQRLQLRSPAQIDFAEGIAVQNLRATWQDAQIQADGRVMPTLAVRASLRDLSPALFAPHLQAAGIDAAQLPAEGKLTLMATLSGSMAEPHGTIALQAADLRWRSGIAAAVPALNVTANTELQGRGPAKVSAQVRSGTGTELSVNGQVPMEPQGALALHLQGRADLGLANGFLEAGGRHASGQATLDAMVSGTLAEPQISGNAGITNGELRDYVQGIRLTAITASFEARERTLQITRFDAKAGRGQVSGSGTIGVLQSGLPIDVKFAFGNAEPIASNLITAQLDGELQLRGKLQERLDLTGTLQVRRAEVTIPNALPVTVATLDVRRPGQKKPAPAPSRFDLGFDLTVNAPQGVFVRGRGLDAELGGQLHLGGTQETPQVGGGFELREGRFSMVGKRLDFQSGRVSFTGEGIARQFDPSLDFIASNISSGVTSTLKISGYADAPVITLESSPELPQDEVLSHLLFGTSVTQLSAFQLAQMAAAVASIGGVGNGGAGALLGLQRSLGLDRLAVGGSGTDTAGATVEAGRYISRRIYVGTKQSTAGGTQAEVEVDVSKRLKLHTTFGNNAGTAQGATTTDQSGNTVGLSYEFEY
jgi:translocation and assembly module TamB